MYKAGVAQQVVTETEKYGLDIVVLQEVRWPNRGECSISKSHILYSGRQDGLHFQGTGFVLSQTAYDALMNFDCVSERISWIRLKCKWYNLSIICAYAPTEIAEDQDKDEFYDELQRTYERLPSHDMRLVIGDMNAKVGRDDTTFKNTIGKHSLHENENDNGFRLLSFAETNQMTVGGTLFPHKDIHKGTWVSRDGRTCNQIDHVLMGKKHKNSLQDVRAFRGADCDSDHYLVVATIKGRITTKPRIKIVKTKRFDTEKLLDNDLRTRYQVAVSNRFEALTEQGDTEPDMEDQWKNIKRVLHDAAEQTVGYKEVRRRNNWFTAECEIAVAKRKEARMNWLQHQKNADSKNKLLEASRTARRVLRQAKQGQMNVMLEKVETDFQSKANRQFFQGIKEMKEGHRSNSNMLKAKDGSVITNDTAILKCWKEYFETLLNRPDPDDPVEAVTDENLEGPTLEPPSRGEVSRIIKHLKNFKAAGEDLIANELIKYGGEEIITQIHNLIKRIWVEIKIPEEWSTGIIIPIYKKGCKFDCANYRGITLLPTVYKILTKVITERLMVYAKHIIGDYQCGFLQGRSTIDQIFILRQIQEKFWEVNRDVYHLFIDFKQAYDSVHRDSLWNILREFQLPSHLVSLIKMCYTDTQCKVRIGKISTDPFRIKSGLRQGDIMSPILFNFALEKVYRVTAAASHGLRIGERSIKMLAYADDVDIIAENKYELSGSAVIWNETAKRAGLQINVEKSKVMVTTRNENTRGAQVGEIGNMDFEKVSEFKYLGSILSDKNEMEAEIKARILSGNRCLHGLRTIMGSRLLTRKTKLRVYNSIIQPVVIYGCETWTLTKAMANKLLVFENTVLRKITGPVYDAAEQRWRRRHNAELREITKQPFVTSVVRSQRLRWAGHLARACPTRAINHILTAKVDGKRPRGRPRLRWADRVKEDVAHLNEDPDKWVEAAQDRIRWRGLVLAAKDHPMV